MTLLNHSQCIFDLMERIVQHNFFIKKIFYPAFRGFILFWNLNGGFFTAKKGKMLITFPSFKMRSFI